MLPIPCPACGYDLRGNPQAERCTECGENVVELREAILKCTKDTIAGLRNLCVLGGASSLFAVLAVAAWLITREKFWTAILSMFAAGLFGLTLISLICALAIVIEGSTNFAQRRALAACGFNRLIKYNLILLVIPPVTIYVAFRFFGFARLILN